MPSTHKKVIVRRFSGDLLHGYLPASGFLDQACVDLLRLDGRRQRVPTDEVRSISFVRDFSLGDITSPERLPRKTFAGRPRGDGLWLRLTFRQDGDDLEGLAAADLSLLDDLLRDGGLSLAPPDTRGNVQRVFIPRAAIANLRLLAVITSARKRAPTARQAETPDAAHAENALQGALFRESIDLSASSERTPDLAGEDHAKA